MVNKTTAIYSIIDDILKAIRHFGSVLKTINIKFVYLFSPIPGLVSVDIQKVWCYNRLQ
jgi:hypothetical protein